MVQIRVIGTGQASTEPDEAGFTFHCRGSGDDARDAHAGAAAAAETLLEQLDALGVARDRRGVQRTVLSSPASSVARLRCLVGE